jgi:hypothetical protein
MKERSIVGYKSAIKKEKKRDKKGSVDREGKFAHNYNHRLDEGA